MITTWTSSISSESKSLLTCSKFHFEEKVLEKLVRLEHKMELFEEKMKTMESSMSKKLKRMDEIEKETETLTETMLDKQLQIETRINDSYQEIINNFKTQSNNETTLYGEKMDSLFDSLSLKSQTLSEAEKERERKIVSMQRDSHEEHKRFQRDAGEKRNSCFLSFRPSSQALSSKEIVIFDGIWTNVGKGYEPITVIFKAPQPGLYHFTAVVMPSSGSTLSLYLHHNELQITRS
ncbi:Hypothetical predicted protein [Mytilus galloprovincialis]|uniref:C1q domain-containing protein n=1 Tax=Mytilus galloprovincialis TaxID=29158 RepID=A0A8B6FSX5_MYTGA|nr:Hypothetical predicted protein [Mytilus galloprovincialis]